MPEPNREQRIFNEALEIASPGERAAFLVAACEGDEALLRRLEALLHASAAPAAFLPGAPGKGPVDRDPELPGAVVGRYKLLEKIGEGGFGIVYMAEQWEPVRRRVALKVIKPGMDSRQVIGRFEAERQALALMEHPNIAQVFDAGATGAGRPYFVMELVRGIPLTKFCEEQALGLEPRLQLFIEVCSAVQHAHQKGVIHRDLKPSNILVTLHGERPVPKVIDFGIAKALGEPLTDKTVFTQFQQLLGTPAYMSPEQAALSGLDVDTRSDIYSLGVLLYELLTGGPPFDSKELLDSGLDGLRKTILEREPERPSTRLTKRLRGQTARAVGFQVSHAQSPIPRELDLIVLKALEKDRDRRYATANGLAADLRRFLNHEPVTAVAPTLGYQLSKFYRRHRKSVTTALAFAALLVIAAVVSISLAIRARRAETVATAKAAAAYNVSEFLWKELLKPLTPWHHTNRGVSLREAFDLAALNIDKRLQGQPLAEASVRFTFARTHIGLAEWTQAETNLLRALALRRTHAPQPDARTADVLFHLGLVRRFQGRWEEAESFHLEAASIRSRALGPHHRDTVIARAKAALDRVGRLPAAEAEALLNRTLDDLRRFVAPDHYLTRETMNRLGELWRDAGKFDEAHTIFEQTYQMAVVDESLFSSSALWALELMATTRARQGRFAEAEKAFLEVIDARARISGADHHFTVTTQLLYVDQVLVPQRRFAEAAPILLQAAATVRSDQPQLRSLFDHTLEATIEGWKTRGGDAEFEVFQRQARAWSDEASR